ncbi:hypothetical protein ATN79_20310 [Paraburkholderia caribensis]|nr:hypothetical protein ATN79_20310 [Paraburkholderia caribensis]
MGLSTFKAGKCKRPLMVQERQRTGINVMTRLKTGFFKRTPGTQTLLVNMEKIRIAKLLVWSGRQ